MPTPKKGEKKQDFISRCMAYPDLQNRKPDQRAAICYSLWTEHHKGKKQAGNILQKFVDRQPTFDRAYVYKDRLEMVHSGNLIKTDDSKLSAEVVISTMETDRVGDQVPPELCYLEHFRANPVVFFGHQVFPFPVGVSEDENGNLTIRIFPKKQMTARCLFHQRTKEAVQTYVLVKDKIIRATSIGFNPLEEPTPISHPTLRQHGHRFGKWELLEWSWVGIPMNPTCTLVRSVLSKGKIGGDRIGPLMQKALEPLSEASPIWAPSGWTGGTMATKKKVKDLNSSSGTAGGYVTDKTKLKEEDDEKEVVLKDDDTLDDEEVKALLAEDDDKPADEDGDIPSEEKDDDDGDMETASVDDDDMETKKDDDEEGSDDATAEDDSDTGDDSAAEDEAPSDALDEGTPEEETPAPEDSDEPLPAEDADVPVADDTTTADDTAASVEEQRLPLGAAMLTSLVGVLRADIDLLEQPEVKRFFEKVLGEAEKVCGKCYPDLDLSSAGHPAAAKDLAMSAPPGSNKDVHVDIVGGDHNIDDEEGEETEQELKKRQVQAVQSYSFQNRAGQTVIVKGLSKFAGRVVKEASDHLKDVGDLADGAFGRVHKAACHYHSKSLKALCQGMTDEESPKRKSVPPLEEDAIDLKAIAKALSPVAKRAAAVEKTYFRLTGKRIEV